VDDDAGAPDDPARRNDEEKRMVDSEMPLPEDHSLDKYDEDGSGGLNAKEQDTAAKDKAHYLPGSMGEPDTAPAKQP
jgi:hypothetical protein